MAANVHKQKEPIWHGLERRKAVDGLERRRDEAEMKTGKEIG